LIIDISDQILVPASIHLNFHLNFVVNPTVRFHTDQIQRNRRENLSLPWLQPSSSLALFNTSNKIHPPKTTTTTTTTISPSKTLQTYLPSPLPNSKNSSKASHSISPTEKSSASKTKTYSTVFTLWFAVTLLYIIHVNSTLLKVFVLISLFFFPMLIRFQGFLMKMLMIMFLLLTVLLLIVMLLKFTLTFFLILFSLKIPAMLLRYVWFVTFN